MKHRTSRTLSNKILGGAIIRFMQKKNKQVVLRNSRSVTASVNRVISDKGDDCYNTVISHSFQGISGFSLPIENEQLERFKIRVGQ